MVPENPFTYAPAPEGRGIVDLKPSYGLFVDGEFTEAHGRSFKTISPATEEVLAEAGEELVSDELAGVSVVQRPVGFVGKYASPTIVRTGATYHAFFAAQRVDGKRSNIPHATFTDSGNWMMSSSHTAPRSRSAR